MSMSKAALGVRKSTQSVVRILASSLTCPVPCVLSFVVYEMSGISPKMLQLSEALALGISLRKKTH